MAFGISPAFWDATMSGSPTQQYLWSTAVSWKVPWHADTGSVKLDITWHDLFRLIPKFIYRLERKQDLPLHGGRLTSKIPKTSKKSSFFGKSKVATSTNRRWQGKKVVPVRRRCSRGEWNFGVVGGLSKHELCPYVPVLANQRIVTTLPRYYWYSHSYLSYSSWMCHIHHVPHSCHIRHSLW